MQFTLLLLFFANTLLPPPSTSLSALALFPLFQKKNRATRWDPPTSICVHMLRLCSQHNGRIQSTKANPSTCALESTPLPLSYISQAIISCLSHIIRFPLCSVCFPSKNIHSSSTLASPPYRCIKPILTLLLFPVIILFSPSSYCKTQQRNYLYSLPKYICPIVPESNPNRFASHHYTEIALVKILLAAKFSVQ